MSESGNEPNFRSWRKAGADGAPLCRSRTSGLESVLRYFLHWQRGRRLEGSWTPHRRVVRIKSSEPGPEPSKTGLAAGCGANRPAAPAASVPVGTAACIKLYNPVRVYGKRGLPRMSLGLSCRLASLKSCTSPTACRVNSWNALAHSEAAARWPSARCQIGGCEGQGLSSRVSVTGLFPPQRARPLH
jgi:hypothetical protein